MNTPSVHAGYLYLARMFCRLVKEATDLANTLCNNSLQVNNFNYFFFFCIPNEFSNKVDNIIITNKKLCPELQIKFV